MDPDAALATIRMLAAALGGRDGWNAAQDDNLDALIEALDGLDTWLSRQGFLPQAWAR